MENPKIGNLEAIAFFVIISINGILLSSSQFLVQQCSSSSLINALFVTIAVIAITFVFCLLLKNFVGNSLLDVSEFLGGKILKFIVGIVFIIYFICRVSFFLRKMSACLQILYYPMTNMIFIASLFCIAAGIIVSLKNNSIFKSAIVLLPILLATIVLVFIGNSKNFHFENIYPILGNGINATFFSGFSNVFAFCGLAYLFFLPSKLRNPEKLTKISIIWNSQSSDITPNMCRKAEVLPQYHIVSYHKCIDINIMKVYDDFSGSRYAGGKTVRRHIGAEREEIK